MSYEVVDGFRDGARRAWDVTEQTASNAKSTVEAAAHTASEGARSTFFDGLEKVTKIAAAVRAFGLDDALLRVGLQRRRSLFADLGLFGAGFVAGAAVTAISTPISGRALRRQLASFLSDLAHKGEEIAEEKVKGAAQQVSSVAHDVKDAAAQKVDGAKQTAMHAKDSALHAKETVVSKVHDITDAVIGETKVGGAASPRGRN